MHGMWWRPDVVETIHTGDENSLRGWEVWCYCRKCDCETFKQIKLKSEIWKGKRLETS